MNQTKLYYFFDPLCGWCYGFSPVITTLEQEYNNISFETICGGMVLGDRIKPLTEMKDYLMEAIPRLQNMTGVSFGQPYLNLLDDDSIAPESETPSVAMMVFKSMKNSSSVAFASALQKELFVKGKNLNELSSYEDLVKDFDMDPEMFLSKMKDETYKRKAYEEFKLSQETGVSGFPSVVLMHENHGYLIARGFRPKSEMNTVINDILSGKINTNKKGES